SSNYDRFVATLAGAGDRVAALLRTQAFVRARHAWTAPWATLRGWNDESYGDALIAVTLRSNAWMAKLSTSKGVSEVVDMADHPVPMEEVLRHPERLAVVYFVQEDAPRYREYVLCNESMVESWSVDTEQTARAIAASADAVGAMRRWLETHPPPEESL